MWQAMAADMGSKMLGGMGGATEGPSSAATSTSASLNSGPFGSGGDWTSYLPLILLAVVVVVYVKKGR